MEGVACASVAIRLVTSRRIERIDDDASTRGVRGARDVRRH